MTVTADMLEHLLDAPDGTSLVLRDGRPVVTDDESDSVVITTKAAIVEQLGDDRSPERLAIAAAALDDMVDKLGA